MTVEDELPPELPERLDAAVGLAERVARYGGLFMALIHTDTTGAKLEFQRRLTLALQARGAWFGRLRDFGAWWSARDAVRWDARRDGKGLELSVAAPEACAGAAFDLPPGAWELRAGPGRMTPDGRRLVVDVPVGNSRWEFRQRP